jgi:protein O-GlcNAc transferase
MLKHLQSVDASSRDGLRRLFERHGVDGERIVIAPWTQSNAWHMSAYRNVDLALDPFPYHGTTTTCDAFAMGVPVAGKTHVSKPGITLLTQVGLRDWITSSPAEYVERAIEYARQPALLRQLRGDLRARLAASDLGQPGPVSVRSEAHGDGSGGYCAEE